MNAELIMNLAKERCAELGITGEEFVKAYIKGVVDACVIIAKNSNELKEETLD